MEQRLAGVPGELQEHDGSAGKAPLPALDFRMLSEQNMICRCRALCSHSVWAEALNLLWETFTSCNIPRMEQLP